MACLVPWAYFPFSVRVVAGHVCQTSTTARRDGTSTRTTSASDGKIAAGRSLLDFSEIPWSSQRSSSRVEGTEPSNDRDEEFKEDAEEPFDIKKFLIRRMMYHKRL